MSHETVSVIEERLTVTVIGDVPSVSVVEEVVQVVIPGVGVQGPRGLPGDGYQFFDFAYGDAQPAVLFTALAGSRVVQCEIAITQSFDGIGASLSIGDTGDNERLMAASDNLPSMVTIFEVTPNFEVVSDTVFRLYITPGAGATTGRGTVGIILQP